MKDKLKHFAVGFLICAALGMIISLWVGFFAGIAAGIAKELYDMTGRGRGGVDRGASLICHLPKGG